MPRPRPVLAFLLGGSIAVAAAGCAASTDSGTGIRIVASTNVYGDLAQAIGGDFVTVDSIIDDPAKDPHEYQADARTQLALSRADVIVRNGGGYDDFVDTMLAASENDHVTVIDAVKLSGFDATAPGFNEHVWYDYPTVGTVVRAIETRLAELDPAHAQEFDDNAAHIQSGLTALEDRVATIRATAAGVGVAITEPVPLYLLGAMGLVNRTPVAFSDAVENDTDASAAVLERTLGLFSSNQVSVLVYNPQTGGPQTDAVLKAATNAGVSSVAAGEVLPDGYHYLEWQSSLIDAITGALED